MTVELDISESTDDDDEAWFIERPPFPLTPDNTVDWDTVRSQEYVPFVEYGAKPRISERMRGMVKRIRAGDSPKGDD